MKEVTPEILPVTWAFSHPPLSWRKVTDGGGGDLVGSPEIPSVSATSQAISLLPCHPRKLFIGLRILLAGASHD